jgi:hypothetical protein
MLPVSALLLLAGEVPNVQVSVNSEGDLLVIGDKEDNNISIDADGSEGNRIRVGFGQTLNGVPGPTELHLARPRSGRLIVSLGDGDDTVWFFAALGRDKFFDLGAGDDFLDLTASSAGAVIHAGPGNDHVHLEDCFVHELLDVDLGPGDDSFEFAFSFTNALRVRADAGDDDVTLRWGGYFGPVSLLGGAGVDLYFDLGENEFLGGPPKIYGFEGPARFWTHLQARVTTHLAAFASPSAFYPVALPRNRDVNP